MDILKSLLQNETVVAVLIPVVAWLLKKLVEYLVVKWPALKKLKLQRKIEWVIAQVDEWRKRYMIENGKKPTVAEVENTVHEITAKDPDPRVNPENVKTLRRAHKNGGFGVNAGISQNNGAFVGFDLTKSF